MAASNGQRIAAFLLAMLFLLSTIGATAYIIWEINREEAGIVQDTNSSDTNQQTAQEEASTACGASTIATVDPRPIPTVTSHTGAITTLEKVDVKVGDGEEVQPGDCVAALYYGTLASNGEKFDGNYESGKPIEFSLTGVIQGWTDGLPGMKVGGVRRLLIPAALAYGDRDNGSIPANSDLIFEVEIVSTRRN